MKSYSDIKKYEYYNKNLKIFKQDLAGLSIKVDFSKESLKKYKQKVQAKLDATIEEHISRIKIYKRKVNEFFKLAYKEIKNNLAPEQYSFYKKILLTREGLAIEKLVELSLIDEENELVKFTHELCTLTLVPKEDFFG